MPGEPCECTSSDLAVRIFLYILSVAVGLFALAMLISVFKEGCTMYSWCPLRRMGYKGRERDPERDTELKGGCNEATG
ncbi:hypothetical protein VTO42DRAFT_1091 [Malbranchea cinnamomea]